MEYIENRIEFLNKLQRLSNMILIRIPMINRDWLVVYKKENGYEYRLDETHFSEYTVEGLKKELNQTGWDSNTYSIQFEELWGSRDKKIKLIYMNKFNYSEWAIDTLACSQCGGNINIEIDKIFCSECKKNYLRGNMISFIDNLDQKEKFSEKDLSFLSKKEEIESGLSANDWNNDEEWTVYDPRATKRMSKVLNYIPKAGLHLDIGVGRGDGTFLISKIKPTIGIEYGTLVSQVAKKRYKNIIQANVAELPFRKEVFDSVTMLETLEHVLNPEKALSEIKRVLKPGGKLIITTPSRKNFRVKKMGVIINYPVIIASIFLKSFKKPEVLRNKIMSKFSANIEGARPAQPVEIPRPAKYVKEIVDQNFKIREKRMVNYWNKYKIIQLFSFSTLYVCEKEN